MKEIISAIRNEMLTLKELVDSLTDDDWLSPTGFKDWSAELIISHLYYFDLMAIYSINKPEKFNEEGQFIFSTFSKEQESLSRAMIILKRLKTSGKKELTDGWLRSNDLMCETFERIDPKTRCKWFGPDMGARMFMTARYMEIWSHAQAIYDLTGKNRIYNDDIKNIVNIGIKTFEWTYINRKLEVPKQKPYIVLNSPSNKQWEWNEPSDENSIYGLASDFCHVVTQNRNVLDTKLEVTGSIANHWMSIAQCFAGDPETPPEKGSRV